jgi:hypothetical protein
LNLIDKNKKNLTYLNHRMQDAQELAKSYAAWITLVRVHQRGALHGMTESALLILLIVLVM